MESPVPVVESPTGGAGPQLLRSDLFVADASHPAQRPVGAASSASMPLLRSFDFLSFAIYKYAAPRGEWRLLKESLPQPIAGEHVTNQRTTVSKTAAFEGCWVSSRVETSRCAPSEIASFLSNVLPKIYALSKRHSPEGAGKGHFRHEFNGCKTGARATP